MFTHEKAFGMLNWASDGSLDQYGQEGYKKKNEVRDCRKQVLYLEAYSRRVNL